MEPFSVDDVEDQDDDEALEGEEEEYVVEMEDPSDMQVCKISVSFCDWSENHFLYQKSYLII